MPNPITAREIGEQSAHKVLRRFGSMVDAANPRIGIPALPPIRLKLARTTLPGAAAELERCDYCGVSRHACGCDERFEYEQIRDNPQLIAR